MELEPETVFPKGLKLHCIQLFQSVSFSAVLEIQTFCETITFRKAS